MREATVCSVSWFIWGKGCVPTNHFAFVAQLCSLFWVSLQALQAHTYFTDWDSQCGVYTKTLVFGFPVSCNISSPVDVGVLEAVGSRLSCSGNCLQLKRAAGPVSCPPCRLHPEMASGGGELRDRQGSLPGGRGCGRFSDPCGCFTCSSRSRFASWGSLVKR